MSEISEAERDGSTLQKNSGRGWIQKGDAVWGPFILDYKEYGKSFSLSKSVWANVTKDAVFHRKEPLLKIILGKGASKLRLFVIEEEMFHEMMESWRKEFNG